MHVRGCRCEAAPREQGLPCLGAARAQGARLLPGCSWEAGTESWESLVSPLPGRGLFSPLGGTIAQQTTREPLGVAVCLLVRSGGGCWMLRGAPGTSRDSELELRAAGHRAGDPANAAPHTRPAVPWTTPPPLAPYFHPAVPWITFPPSSTAFPFSPACNTANTTLLHEPKLDKNNKR